MAGDAANEARYSMNALLVRVGADQTEAGGGFNGSVDSHTRQFAYAPILETGVFRSGMATPYSMVSPSLRPFGVSLPRKLARANMHLDPDFRYLTYGDSNRRASQIKTALTSGDLIVFYAGLRDVHPSPRLVYALIGLYVIETILPAPSVPSSQYYENAYTRLVRPNSSEIVVRAKPGVSGRLRNCLPIGSFRAPTSQPNQRPCYRVEPNLLANWGDLKVNDGYLQRSGYLPSFRNPERFYKWFLDQKPVFMTVNN
jgi:hypothetical protein